MMAMRRWRTETRRFLIFNVVMLGLVSAALVIADSSTSFEGFVFFGLLGLFAAFFIWPLGAIVLGMA
jgi:hypothetical protein